MKNLSIAFLCIATMFGLAFGEEEDSSSGEDAYKCVFAAHCDLGEVRAIAMECYEHLDEEAKEIIKGKWAAGESEQEMVTSIEKYCGMKEDERKRIYEGVAQETMDEMMEVCKDDKDNPACQRWMAFTECLGELVEDQKSQGNC